MLYVLHNHGHINELQTMVQVFFPNEKFNAVDVRHETIDREAAFIIESRMDLDIIFAGVYQKNKCLAEYSWDLNNISPFLNERRVIMLCLYHVLQQAVGASTPWGALTGIRPSKLVREWLDNHHHEAEILTTLTETYWVCKEKAQLAITVAHAEKRLTPPPATIGIYVSIPFCPTRCIYCSFNTAHKPAGIDLQEQYSAALIRECFEKAAQARAMGATISSIYIGGGTPTILSENLLEKVLNAIGENFGSATEYTVEAGRPDTLTPAKLKLMRQYGVNRIAVNPQTLNDKTLSAIGRVHTSADFFTAFEAAREAGFACINTDLIAGLPDETADDMHRSMEALAKLAPENITIHTLAVKRASILKDKGVIASSLSPIAEMLSIASKACAQMGLSPYYLYRQKNMVGLFENVGYSKPNHECLYNIGMMAEVQTILGIGAGAVTKYVEGNKISREFNAKNPEIYIERRCK